MPNARLQSDLNPQAFPSDGGFPPLATPPPGSGVLPDSSTEIGMFPHLVVRHNIERVLVQGEGHVPEDGADAVLHHGQRLVEHPSLRSAVHPDLRRQRDTNVMPNEAITSSFQYACNEISAPLQKSIINQLLFVSQHNFTFSFHLHSHKNKSF